MLSWKLFQHNANSSSIFHIKILRQWSAATTHNHTLYEAMSMRTAATTISRQPKMSMQHHNSEAPSSSTDHRHYMCSIRHRKTQCHILCCWLADNLELADYCLVINVVIRIGFRTLFYSLCKQRARHSNFVQLRCTTYLILLIWMTRELKWN